ncbi:uncharacterized protein LOC113211336 [Frankliniella occidentalis]|uniref:Uncharacterized protein LOC113211336 n=1 Tax=Frankliniella occidentalis TaxID=133901 RepID=A0A6J1SX74_FRAOC|nr:uncharacterized protein LOC113211336 [Frankliniella occidentalis]
MLQDMLAFILVVVVLTNQSGVYGTTILSSIGPYKAVTERFLDFEHSESQNHSRPWRWHLRTTHFNPQKPKEIQLLNGNVTAVNRTFDDSLPAAVILDIRSNNQWKENAFVFRFRKRACTALRTNIPFFYDALFKKSEMKGVCSHGPGVYEVNNVPVEWTFPNVPIMPYGVYRFRLMCGREEDLIFSGAAECRLVPRLE